MSSASSISNAFYNWINNTTGIENCYFNITDYDNNVYVVGSTNSTTITINNIIYYTSGHKKYIIKFNSSGTVVWLKTFGGDPTFTGITVNNNYLYLSLIVVSTIVYDSVIYSFLGNSTTNGAIIKINIATGAGIWVKYLYRTSFGSVECNGLVVDNNDYLYICGVSPNSSFILGRTADSGGTQTITGGSTLNIRNGFVIKIDGANTTGWYKSTRWIQITHPDPMYYSVINIFCTSIILDSTSTNVYLYGYSRSTELVINSGTYPIATNISSCATYLVKLLTSDFSVGWVKSVDGDSVTFDEGERNEAKTITLDTLDNPIITGYTNSTSVVVNSVTYTKGVSTTNTFVVKFNTDGSTSAFKWIVGGSSDYSYSIESDTYDNIYVVGASTSSFIDIDGTIYTHSYTGYQPFIIKLDPSLTTIWFYWMDGSGTNKNNYFRSITLGTNNNIYMTGYSDSSNITFNDVLYTRGDTTYAGFLFKLYQIEPMTLKYSNILVNDTVVLPIKSISSGVTINWGDGVTETNITTNNPSHQYTNNYTSVNIIITNGSFTKFGTTNISETIENISKLTHCYSFGLTYNDTITDLSGAFQNASNLVLVSEIIPPYTNNFSYMFYGATLFNDQSVINWKFNIFDTNLSHMFQGATTFNRSLVNWVSSPSSLKISDASYMFYGATAFNNGSITMSSWSDTMNNVSDTSYMFYNASSFNVNINNWFSSGFNNLYNMSYMFYGASSFNQNLGGWDVTKVGPINGGNMTGLFTGSGISKLYYTNTLINWGIKSLQSNVTLDANSITYYSEATYYKNILQSTYGWTINDAGVSGQLDTMMVLNYNNISANLVSYYIPLYDFNTGTSLIIDWGDGLTSLHSSRPIHTYADNFSQAVIKIENVSSPCARLFGLEGYPGPINQGIGDLYAVISFGNQPLTSLKGAFYFASKLSIVPFSIPSSITSLDFCFGSSSVINSPAISSWDVSNVVSMYQAFRAAPKFNQSLSTWNVSNVTNMESMFEFATVFNQNLGSWNIKKVSNMTSMFLYSGLRTTNYDSLLLGWSGLTGLQSNVNFNAGSAKYTYGVVSDARLSIITNYNWTITDNGVSGLPTPMTLTCRTGATTDKRIVYLPLYGTVDVTVSWGDGGSNTYITSGDKTHTYPASNTTYTITINKTLTQFGKGGETYLNPELLTSVTNFGGIRLTSLAGAFRDAYNLTSVPASLPTTSTITDLSHCFRGATGINSSNIASWNVSGVTNMSYMFNGASAFNQNISSWNVSNVSAMNYMFYGASAFNKDISSWNIIAVDTINNGGMSGMLTNTAISETNYTNILSGWSSKSVKSNIILGANNLYYYDTGITGKNILQTTYGWTITDSGSVGPVPTPMTLKYITTSSNTTVVLPIKNITSGQNVSVDWGNGTSTIYTTNNPSNLYSTIGTYNVTITPARNNTFNTYGFDIPTAITGNNVLKTVSSFGSIALTSLKGAFYGAGITGVPSSIPSTVTDLSYLFYNATLFNQNISSWNVSGITTMDYMFYGATTFNKNLGPLNILGISAIYSGGMSGMLINTAINETNYTNTLSEWSSKAVNSNIILGANTLYHSEAGLTFKNILQTTYGWTIFDMGPTPIPMTLRYVTTLSNATVILPIKNIASGQNVLVDWGNGTTGLFTTDNPSKVYTSAGTYNVSIRGLKYNTFTIYGFTSATTPSTITGNNYLRTVSSFGNIPLTSLKGAFYGSGITGVPSSIPTTITDCSYIFFQSTSFNDANIISWNTSNVTTMYAMFFNASAFNQDISSWNVSNVTSMGNMFYGATQFNKPLNSWNVSKVTTMNTMFYNANKFNQPLNSWDLSSLTTMDGMFSLAAAFNQNISSWNTSNVTIMTYVFESATAFNQNLASWNVTKVTTMDYMFTSSGLTSSNYDLILIGWGSQNVKSNVLLRAGTNNTYSYGAGSDARYNLVTNKGWVITDSGLDTTTLPTPMSIDYITTVSNPTITLPLYGSIVDVIINWGDGSAEETFTTAGNKNHTYATAGTYTVLIKKTLNRFGNQGATYLNADRISKVNNFGGIRLTSLAGAFRDAINLTQITALPTTSTITDLSYCFRGATGFNDSYITNWDVSGVSAMNYTFKDAISFNRNLASWNVTAVDSVNSGGMVEMFDNSGLNTLNYTNILNGWSTQSVKSNIILGATGINYYSEGITARNILTTIKNWTINDGDDAGPTPITYPIILTYGNITNGTTIVLPIKNVSNLYLIDWGDNTTTINNIVNPSHTYTSTYSSVTINITNENPFLNSFTHFGITAIPETIQNINKLTSVSSFGSILLTSLKGAFYNATQLLSVPTVLPQYSNVTDLSYTLYGTSLFDQSLTGWNISGITNMDNMLTNSGFSTTNYDNILVSWPEQAIQSNTVLGVGSTKFTYGAPSNSKFNLIKNYNWTITDGGIVIESLPPPMILEYQTTIADDIITLPLYGIVNALVNWGDGTPIQYFYIEGDKEHSYIVPGTYTVLINNYLTQFGNGSTSYSNADKLTKVLSFGEIGLTSLSGAFQNASNLIQITGLPSTSQITDISYCFKNATSFNDMVISQWNVTSITTMESLFEGASAFNQSLNDWSSKTDNTTTMKNMFKNAIAFNQDINTWHLQNVITMESMFDGAISFDQDLSDLDFTNVLITDNIFRNVNLSVANYDALLASLYLQTLQPNLNFNAGLSKYTYGSISDKRLSIIKTYNWTITDGGTDPTTLPIPMLLEYQTTASSESITLPLYGAIVDVVVNWGDGTTAEEFITTGNKTHIYSSAGTYTVQIDKTLTQFGNGSTGYPNADKLAKVKSFGALRTTSLAGAFKDAINLVEITGIPSTSLSITNLAYTFMGASALNDPQINNWHTFHVTNLTSTFEGAISFDQALTGWNIVNVLTMDRMFNGVTLSPSRYSDTLISWNAQNVQSNVVFDGGYSKYLYGSGSDAIYYLKTNKNWIITDGGVSNLPSPMLLEYQTTAPSESITLPLYGYLVDVVVDWGDGTTSQEFLTSGDKTHTYDTSGTYTVQIDKKFQQFGKGSSSYANVDKLTKIISFGEVGLTSLAGAFQNATNLIQITALPSVNSNIVDLSYTFKNATSFNDPIISEWDTSTITTMVSMFEGATGFNQPVGNWNISNVSAMNNMFKSVQLSKTNYDNLLVGWANAINEPKTNVNFNGGSSIYSFNAPDTARTKLINLYNWTITDGGRESNNPPVVEDITASVISNGYQTITLIATDIDFHPLTLSIYTEPSEGVLGPINVNQVEYTPTVDYNGIDTFTYRAYDGRQYSNIGTVTINVRSPEQQQTEILANINTELIQSGITMDPIIESSIVSNISNLSVNNTLSDNIDIYLNLLIDYKFGTTIEQFDIGTGITYSFIIDTIDKVNAIHNPINAEAIANDITQFTITEQPKKDLLNDVLVEKSDNPTIINRDTIMFLFDPYYTGPDPNYYTINITNIDVTTTNIFCNSQVIKIINNTIEKNLELNYEIVDSEYVRYWKKFATNKKYYLDDKISFGPSRYLSVLGFGSSLFGYIPNPPPDLNNFVITIYIPNDGDSMTLPLNGVSSVFINWDDGSQTTEVSETYEHLYDSEGTYYIEISGNITQFGNGLTGYPNADKIQDILSWGNLGLTSLSGAFKDAVNITSVPNTLPTTITDISYMFYGASLFNSVNVLNWNLTNVENINYVFLKASAFNRNIGNWNFTNTDLRKWKFIYYQATAYNQELSGWIYDKISKLF